MAVVPCHLTSIGRQGFASKDEDYNQIFCKDNIVLGCAVFGRMVKHGVAQALAVFVLGWQYGPVCVDLAACHTGVLSAPPALSLRGHFAIGVGGSGARCTANLRVIEYPLSHS